MLDEKLLLEMGNNDGEEIEKGFYQLFLTLITVRKNHRFAVFHHHGPKQWKDQSYRNTTTFFHINICKFVNDGAENGTQLNLNALHRIVRQFFQ